MAEMHPILWSAYHQTGAPNPGTVRWWSSPPSSIAASTARHPHGLQPQTDLAIPNFIANYIIKNGSR